MAEKENILKKAYVFFFVLVIFGGLISAKIVDVQFFKKAEIEKSVSTKSSKYRKVPAKRGDIYASDGSLLATSLNFYEVGFDLGSKAFLVDSFKTNLSELCDSLESLLGKKSAKQYREELLEGRRNERRWYSLSRELSYPDFIRLKKFPFIKEGRYKSGFVYKRFIKRQKPFGVLAARTIGQKAPIGLEGAYDSYLKGQDGEQYQRRISGGVWVPVSDGNSVEPVDGSDLYSTIDINIQEITENALKDRLFHHNANNGCAVVMEVKTGKIKAIANLQIDTVGNFWEPVNYAIGDAVEPGSTFKLASLMALLEDQKVKLTDKVNIGHGVMKFHDRTMRDSHYYKKRRTVTVKEGFEISSNVMFAKLVEENYGKTPQSYVNRLFRFNLQDKLGVDIHGEGNPVIKDPNDKTQWYGTTLPWMSHGYSIQLTPIHVLSLYNAVANEGKMVKPYFIEKIENKGTVQKEIGTTVINHAICSKETNDKLKDCLEGVVVNGTAKIPFKNASYKVAGKTGTAQIDYGRRRQGDKTKYRASFVGYFPADNPIYSCIVVITDPKKNGYYGSNCAAPVFREISDKLYTSDYSLRTQLGIETKKDNTSSKVSKGVDLKTVISALDIEDNSTDVTWGGSKVENGVGKIVERKVSETSIPNVKGMLLHDALYVLENLGLKVIVSGTGVVRNQSLQVGSEVITGKTIKLNLG